MLGCGGIPLEICATLPSVAPLRIRLPHIEAIHRHSSQAYFSRRINQLSPPCLWFPFTKVRASMFTLVVEPALELRAARNPSIVVVENC
jgi:hypothetical protein